MITQSPSNSVDRSFWSRRRRTLALVLVGGAILVGCSSNMGYHGFEFDNRLDVHVRVGLLGVNGADAPVTDLGPGQEHSIPGFPGLTSDGNPCRVMTLIARDDQGTEVARHEGEICLDGHWAIGGPPDTPSPIVPVIIVIALAVAALGAILIGRAWARVSRS